MNLTKEKVMEVKVHHTFVNGRHGEFVIDELRELHNH